MIKRVVTITIALMLLIVPIAYGNSAPEHKYTDEKMLDVACHIDITEVNIGEELTFEMTVTNLTGYDIWIEYISFYQLGKSNYWEGFYDVVESENKEVIKRFESIVYEFTCEIGRDLDFYREGNEFYVDVEPYIEFWIDNHYDYRDLYTFGNNPVSLKVANLNDANELFDYAWLDGRDTFYFHGLEHRPYDASNEELLPIGSTYYELLITNKSGETVHELSLDDEMYIYEYYWDLLFPDDEISDTYILRYTDLFLHRGEYYAIYAEREYDVGYLEPPNINMEIAPVNADRDDFFEIKIINASDQTIENLLFTTEEDKHSIYNEDYFRIGDLSADSQWTIKGVPKAGGYELEIIVGYLAEDLLYNWTIDIDLPIEDTLYFSPIEFNTDLYYCDCIDYQYRIEEKERSEQAAIATETLKPTEQITPTASITAAPSTTAEVVVKKRYNGYTWSLVGVGIMLVLAIVAAGLIISVIVKKGKE